MATFKAIPTNIISGFLGVGKTTAILHLLKTKPAEECWAVLVNEFGEVGIDGDILQAEGSDVSNISVKEVPGGCMCCSVDMLSRVALNQLIIEQNPDRILIEPTGLAHPRQVLELFSDQHYQGVLELRATVTLVDPWCLSDQQFSTLPAFQEQIQLADVLVATKADIADKNLVEDFYQYAEFLQPKKTRVSAINHGELPWQWLDLPKIESINKSNSSTHHHQVPDNKLEAQESVPTELQRIENVTEFANSCGWVFPEQYIFCDESLLALINALDIPRVKGIFNTDQGRRIINKMRKTVSHESVSGKQMLGSRVEMISIDAVLWSDIETQLMKCLVDKNIG